MTLVVPEMMVVKPDRAREGLRGMVIEAAIIYSDVFGVVTSEADSGTAPMIDAICEAIAPATELITDELEVGTVSAIVDSNVVSVAGEASGELFSLSAWVIELEGLAKF